jgi:hypothetical protein
MRVVVFVLMLALAGCSTVSSISDSVKRYDESLVAGGWSVRCNDDQYKDERTCFAGTFGDTTYKLKFFQIAYVDGRGPLLLTPSDFPGRTPSVRVDNGPVLTDPTAIVAALRQGGTAYVLFHAWPDGEKRMTVRLEGFGTAYDALLAKVGSK